MAKYTKQEAQVVEVLKRHLNDQGYIETYIGELAKEIADEFNNFSDLQAKDVPSRELAL